MCGLETWLRGGGDPGVKATLFLSFLGRVQLSDTCLCGPWKRRQTVRGLETWLLSGGDPGVTVAPFLSFLGPDPWACAAV